MPQLGIPFTQELYDLVKKAAESDKRSMANWVKLILKEAAVKELKRK